MNHQGTAPPAAVAAETASSSPGSPPQPALAADRPPAQTAHPRRRRRPGGRLDTCCPGGTRRGEPGRHPQPKRRAGRPALPPASSRPPSRMPRGGRRGAASATKPPGCWATTATRRAPARAARAQRDRRSFCMRDSRRPHRRKQANVISSDSFNARSCRMEDVAYAHAYVPIGIFTHQVLTSRTARN
jgi:hypothetical protein